MCAPRQKGSALISIKDVPLLRRLENDARSKAFRRWMNMPEQPLRAAARLPLTCLKAAVRNRQPWVNRWPTALCSASPIAVTRNRSVEIRRSDGAVAARFPLVAD